MKLLQVIGFVILFVLNDLEVVGQWTNYTIESTKGLQANSVRSIKTDNSGKVWFATENGVFSRNRHSYEWSRYSTSSGLGSNDVNGLFLIASNGKMAAATDNGAFFLSTSGFIELDSQLPFPIISDGAATTTGNFWVASNGGGITHRSQGGNYFTYTTDSGLPTNFYRCVFKDESSGTLWFGSSNSGVLSYSETEGWHQYTMSDGLAGNTILDICEDADGNIWLAGSNGISKWVNGQWHSITNVLGANSNNYLSLELAPDNTIWAGGDNGIDIFGNGGIVDHLSTTDGLNSNVVTAICHDLDGNIWVGHSETGASGFVNGEWKDFSGLTGLGQYTSCMVEDDNGRFFFGHQAGVTMFDGINWIQFGVDKGFENTRISYIGKSPDGTIWANGNSRYSLFDGTNWEHHQKPAEATGSYYPMIIASDGSKWFGSYGGVHRIAPNGNTTFYNKNDVMMGRDPIDIIEDSEHKIWISNSKGICRFKLGVWTSYPIENIPNSNINYGDRKLSLSSENVPVLARFESSITPFTLETIRKWDVMELRNNQYAIAGTHIWENSYNYNIDPSYILSTSNGNTLVSADYNQSRGFVEFRTDGSTFLHSTSTGILDNRIKFMYEDSEKRIWLISNSGLSRSDAALVGITEHTPTEAKKGIKAFPNPSEGSLTIEFLSELSEEEISIHDITGRLERKWLQRLHPNTVNQIDIDLFGSAAGIYIITTSNGIHQPTKLILTNTTSP